MFAEKQLLFIVRPHTDDFNRLDIAKDLVDLTKTAALNPRRVDAGVRPLSQLLERLLHAISIPVLLLP
jgi:hypothetical protein